MTAGAGAEALFATLLAEQPSQPFVTFYDDATGERVELSTRSLANWVAKTHFLLLDELGLGVGDLAYVALPADWITVSVLLGCWSAGLQVTTTPGVAAVAFVQPSTLAEAGGTPDTFVINPASMTRAHSGAAPMGAVDYVAAVRPQADNWATVRFPAGPTDSATDSMTRSELSAAARERASALGLTPGARVLSVQPWTGPDDWIDALLAPMSVAGSIVLVAHADPTRHDRRIEQENVTAEL